MTFKSIGIAASIIDNCPVRGSAIARDEEREEAAEEDVEETSSSATRGPGKEE